jgi:hypothetical protein
MLPSGMAIVKNLSLWTCWINPHSTVKEGSR